ncbi:MAG: CRTAC1 family protein [Planctomycetota bacterium]
MSNLHRARLRPGLVHAALCVACACLAPACEKAAEQPKDPGPAQYAPPRFEVENAPQAPDLVFTDVAKESGVTFRHENGSFGQKYLPETMGAGVCVFDADGDQWLDVLFVQGSYWPGKGTNPPAMKLYRNRHHADGGALQFEDITTAAGLELPMYGMGATAADYDGDGDADLYVTTIEGNRLFENDGHGMFTDVTARACVGGETWRDKDGRENHTWSTSAAWLDYDNDGWLDLFVCNYVRWSIAEDIKTSLTGLDKAFTKPDPYQGQSCVLYRNKGDGSFEDVSKKAGVYNPAGKSLGVAVGDVNQDGWVDIVVANDTQPNYLYVNSGDGHFTDMGMALGIAYDDSGRARAGMGIDIADYNNDGKCVIAIGNFSGEPVSFFRQTKGTFFIDGSAPVRISTPTLQMLKFGLAFFDCDRDGRLDLMIANGHIEPDINRVQREITHAQPLQLFWNAGNAGFALVNHVPALEQPIVGRGLAYGDLDQDGDIDVVVSTNGGPGKILRNDQHAGAHWLRIDLAMTSGKNRRGLGAVVTLKTGEATQQRMVHTGSSYLSQSELTLTFGLGKSTRVDELAVRWPGGKTESFDVPGVDRSYVLEQGKGK